MNWMLFWTAVYAIATCVLVTGIGIAIWQIIVTRKNTAEQLEAARKSTNAQLAVELFRELRSEETLNTLRFIYDLKPDHIKDLHPTDMNNIDSLLDKFEMISALVNHEIVDKRIAIDVFAGPPALRCWHQLAEYIRAKGNKRGFFIKHYEAFTRSTLEYFHNADTEIYLYLRWEKEGIPLVKKFFEWRDNKNPCWPRSLEEIERKLENS